jgi:hypothetical protein
MIEPIANFTTTGTTAGITLSSIPGTYKHLMLVSNVKATSLSDVGIQVNGSTGGSDYNTHMLWGNGTTGNTYRFTGSRFQITNWSYADTTVFNQSIVYFQNYANTNLWKTVNCKSVRGNSGGGVDVIQGHWHGTSAITSMYIFGTTGNFVAGCTFSLYGII